RQNPLIRKNLHTFPSHEQCELTVGSSFFFSLFSVLVFSGMAFYALFALPGAILLFMLLGLTARKPGLMRGCLCGSIPYTVLAIFFTILFALIAVLLGEGTRYEKPVCSLPHVVT